MQELELESSWKVLMKNWKYMYTLTLTTNVGHMVLIGYILRNLV